MAQGLMGIIENIFSKKNKDTAKLQPLVDAIKERRTQYEALSDDELRAKRDEYKSRYAAGE